MPLPAGYHEPLMTPRAARCVEATWTYRAQTAGRSLVLPDGRCDVIVRLSPRLRPYAVLTGAATQPYAVTYARGDQWVGLRMRPGLGRAIWGAQLAGSRDSALRGDAALAALPELEQVLAHGQDVEAIRAALLALPCLAAAPPCPAPVQTALDRLHLTGGRLSVADLATLLTITPRQVARLFQKYIGLTPKTYAQLIRFHRAVSLLRRGHLSLTQVALEAGYSDQPHLTRHIRRFGGFAPNALPAQLSQPGCLE